MKILVLRDVCKILSIIDFIKIKRMIKIGYLFFYYI